MKKIVSFLSAISLVAALSAPAMAANDIAVKVDGRTITFREDPKPVVMNDRTYVPLRRVLNSMGAKVEWNEEDRTVKVESKDNITQLILTIDSKEITVYTFKSLLSAEKSTIESDVAPIIINDRTMLPIRVIAEALGSTVSYDESGIAEIITKQATKNVKWNYGADTDSEDFSLTKTVTENAPKLGISCDAKDIKAGDEVIVKVYAKDTEKVGEDAAVSGIGACVFYEPDKFEFDGFACISNEGEKEPSLSANNPNFYDDAVKIISVFAKGSEYLPAKDGTIMELKFKALTNGGGTFSLSDGISEIGYDAELILTTEDATHNLYKYTDLYVDSTPITIE